MNRRLFRGLTALLLSVPAQSQETKPPAFLYVDVHPSAPNAEMVGGRFRAGSRYDHYYALQNAIWFVCSSPLGPWVVADAIPAEIYPIRPSSPLYHVRFVYVYSSSPDYVEFGYTPGYLGAFVSDGVVVLGTGWSYPGWCVPPVGPGY